MMLVGNLPENPCTITLRYGQEFFRQLSTLSQKTQGQGSTIPNLCNAFQSQHIETPSTSNLFIR